MSKKGLYANIHAKRKRIKVRGSDGAGQKNSSDPFDAKTNEIG